MFSLDSSFNPPRRSPRGLWCVGVSVWGCSMGEEGVVSVVQEVRLSDFLEAHRR
jgi:hypothetical protein